MLISSLQLHTCRHIPTSSSLLNFHNFLSFVLQDSQFFVGLGLFSFSQKAGDLISVSSGRSLSVCVYRYMGRSTEKCGRKFHYQHEKDAPGFTAKQYCIVKHLISAVKKELCFCFYSLRLNFYGRKPWLSPFPGASYESMEQVRFLSVWMTSKQFDHWQSLRASKMPVKMIPLETKLLAVCKSFLPVGVISSFSRAYSLTSLWVDVHRESKTNKKKNLLEVSVTALKQGH